MQLNKNKGILLALLMFPVWSFAQQTSTNSSLSYFSNPLFNILFILIIALLVIIIVMGKALKSVVESDYIANKLKKKREEQSKNSGTKIASILILLFAASQLKAGNAGSANDWMVGGLDMPTFYLMLCIIAFEVSIIAVIYYITITIINDGKPEKVKATKVKSKTILERINASVAVEKEKDIMLEHDYDGIRELDNDLPPWWRYGFYVTIVAGVIYMINFHVVKTGDLQDEEYDKSVAQAKLEVEAYMKTAASNVDETSVKQMEGTDVEKGKEVFIANCAACHGKEGQGTVGPNLTDPYWLHGGSLADVFKSIKYGWVDKGMKSWKEDLSPVQIAQVSSFIKTLSGSNPSGAKAPQGDLYTEKDTIATDSISSITDSLKIAKDSIK
ncbi:MAG TPA: cbb3-type cytochrome c oxidase N-terminal domain-containing protein [Bacteroidia bacterium]